MSEFPLWDVCPTPHPPYVVWLPAEHQAASEMFLDTLIYPTEQSWKVSILIRTLQRQEGEEVMFSH